MMERLWISGSISLLAMRCFVLEKDKKKKQFMLSAHKLDITQILGVRSCLIDEKSRCVKFQSENPYGIPTLRDNCYIRNPGRAIFINLISNCEHFQRRMTKDLANETINSNS